MSTDTSCAAAIMTVRSRAVTVTDVVNGSVYTFKVAAGALEQSRSVDFVDVIQDG